MLMTALITALHFDEGQHLQRKPSNAANHFNAQAVLKGVASQFTFRFGFAFLADVGLAGFGDGLGFHSEV